VVVLPTSSLHNSPAGTIIFVSGQQSETHEFVFDLCQL
jgi:hypothetical protein